MLPTVDRRNNVKNAFEKLILKAFGLRSNITLLSGVLFTLLITPARLLLFEQTAHHLLHR